ncbi:hypothetical protein TYRP_009796 [Tyrophagus putrescentiae]|nr:hypothetical protein TYRP_009796 [Tyrophagus putrescentiae]
MFVKQIVVKFGFALLKSWKNGCVQLRRQPPDRCHFLRLHRHLLLSFPVVMICSWKIDERFDESCTRRSAPRRSTLTW